MSSQTRTPPAAGSPKQDEILEFTFDTNGAVFERAGDDLIIVFKDGNQIVLYDFYIEEDPKDGPEMLLMGASSPVGGEALTLESVLDIREHDIFPADPPLSPVEVPMVEETASQPLPETSVSAPVESTAVASFTLPDDSDADLLLLTRLELGVF